MSNFALPILPLALTAALAACSKPGDATPAAAPPAANTAQADTSEPAKAREAAVKPTPDERVGTLAPETGLAVGQPAPDAELVDADAKVVSLATLYARGATLVVFYRGGWCPFCNAQLHALSKAHPDFTRRGVSLVAVSVDRAEEAARSRASWTIPFPVLSDPKLVAHRAFRVTQDIDDTETERLRGFGIDLERASGETHHTIAIPSIFLVDAAGVVRWAHVDREYKVRPSVPQLLAVIDRVLGATP